MRKIVSFVLTVFKMYIWTALRFNCDILLKCYQEFPKCTYKPQQKQLSFLSNKGDDPKWERKFGSISVSGQLPTYPSPNPTLTSNCCQLTVVDLGEGQVGSCLELPTDIDPKVLSFLLAQPIRTQICFSLPASIPFMHLDWFLPMVYWRRDAQMIYKPNTIHCCHGYVQQNITEDVQCGKNISDTLGCTLCIIFSSYHILTSLLFCF